MREPFPFSSASVTMPIILPPLIPRTDSSFDWRVGLYRGSCNRISITGLAAIALQPYRWKDKQRSYGNLAYEDDGSFAGPSGLTFGGRWAERAGTGRSLRLSFDDDSKQKMNRLKRSNFSFGFRSPVYQRDNRSEILDSDDDEEEYRQSRRQAAGDGFWLHTSTEGQQQPVAAPRTSKPPTPKKGVVSLEKAGVVILKKTGLFGQKFGGVPVAFEQKTSFTQKMAPSIRVDEFPKSPKHKRVELLREQKKATLSTSIRFDSAGDLKEADLKSAESLPLDKLGSEADGAKKVHRDEKPGFQEKKDERDKRTSHTPKDDPSKSPSRSKLKTKDDGTVEKARARVVKLSDILLEKNKEKIIDSWVAHTVQFVGSEEQEVEEKEKECSRPLEEVGKQMEAVLRGIEMKVQEEMTRSLQRLSAEYETEVERSPDESSIVTVLRKDGRKNSTPLEISPEVDDMPRSAAALKSSSAAKDTSITKPNVGTASWTNPKVTSSPRKSKPSATSVGDDSEASTETISSKASSSVPFFSVSGSEAKTKSLDKRDLLKSTMTLDLSPRDTKTKSSKRSLNIKATGAATKKPADHSAEKKHDCGATSVGPERQKEVPKSVRATITEGTSSLIRSAQVSKAPSVGRGVDGGSVKGGPSTRSRERDPASTKHGVDSGRDDSQDSSSSRPASSSSLDTSRPPSSGSSGRGGLYERSSSESSRDSVTGGTRSKSRITKPQQEKGPQRWK